MSAIRDRHRAALRTVGWRGTKAKRRRRGLPLPVAERTVEAGWTWLWVRDGRPPAEPEPPVRR